MTKEEVKIQQAARRFAVEVLRPAGVALDRLRDPGEVIAPKSELWAVIKKHRQTGLHRLVIPPAYGGDFGKVSPRCSALASEELGYGDAGLGISLSVSGMPFALTVLSTDPKVRQWAGAYAEDTAGELIGCWAITEPNHGSDWVLGTTEAGADPGIAPTLTGIKKGDEYILNGQKSAWVSNGTIATHAVLHVGLDSSKGMQGQGLAFCPLDLPGISRGKPLNKIGQRALNQGELFFDDVRLPKSHMIFASSGLSAMGGFSRIMLARANTETALIMSGLGRAIFDHVIDILQAKEEAGRLAGNLIYHRNALFQMFAQVEAAAALARNAAQRYESAIAKKAPENRPLSRILASKTPYAVTARLLKINLDIFSRLLERKAFERAVRRYFRTPGAQAAMGKGKYGIAAKIVATNTAFQAAAKGMRILGLKSRSAEMQIEKFYRDARTSIIEDGCNDALALAASEDL